MAMVRDGATKSGASGIPVVLLGLKKVRRRFETTRRAEVGSGGVPTTSMKVDVFSDSAITHPVGNAVGSTALWILACTTCAETVCRRDV